MTRKERERERETSRESEARMCSNNNIALQIELNGKERESLTNSVGDLTATFF
jgi:hypothetical protein